MFTYFKKKQDDQKSSQQKALPNLLSGQNNPLGNSKNYVDNSLKLPSDIFAQLLNQSTSSDNTVKENNGKDLINEKQSKQSLEGSDQQPDQSDKNDREETLKTEHQNNGENGEKREKLQQQKQPQQHEQKSKPIILNPPKHHSPLPSISLTSKLPLPSESTTLSSLSQAQLHQLFSMFTDIISKEVESEVVGQKLQQKELEFYLPSTLQTIKKLNSSFYQRFILETKEKYNQLVDQSTNLFLKSRQIANLVNEFVMSINLFFQSQELLIPAQQIHNAIAQLNPQKTQKYINYLIKIFESNFDDVIEKRVSNTKVSLENEIRKSQRQFKQLEQEHKKVSSVLKQKQSTFQQQQNKFSQKQLQITTLKREINELNIRLNNIHSSSKQTQEDYHSELSLLKKHLQRAKKQGQEANEKIKRQQKLIQKKENLLLEKQDEIQNLGEVIKKVKQVDSQGMEDIVQEMEMKEKMFSDKIQKFNTEKIQLQHKIRTLQTHNESLQARINQFANDSLTLKEEITKLNEQLTKNSQENNQNAQEIHEQSQSQGMSAQNSPQKVKSTKRIIKEQQDSQQEQKPIETSQLINKQIFRHLFLSFDDESKQWAVRRNIRNQIYIMLDIKKGTNTNSNQQLPQKSAIIKASKTNPLNTSNKDTEKKSTDSSIIGKWLGW